MELETKREQLQQEVKEMGDLLSSQRQEAMDVSICKGFSQFIEKTLLWTSF